MQSGLQSGLGRRGQGSGDALAEATAPAEGGTGAEQGQGGRDGGCRGAKYQLNCLTGAVEGSSADQARCGEAEACEGCAIEGGTADNWCV
jgi:hypothetical protein